jgi:hypothetical protein
MFRSLEQADAFLARFKINKQGVAELGNPPHLRAFLKNAIDADCQWVTFDAVGGLDRGTILPIGSFIENAERTLARWSEAEPGAT